MRNQIPAPDMEIKPGWDNGVIELLDPPERGWKLLEQTVILKVEPDER